MKQILIDVSLQKLFCVEQHKILKTFLVSTGVNGVGEKKGSGQTPRGWHIIRAKIGAGYPENTIFVGRRPLCEIYTPTLGAQFPKRDWILTRILWLSGLELHKNRLGDCDTMQRFIYIHGCPDSRQLGIPLSKGCVRMHNKDIIELFDDVSVGTKVLIRE